jgi:dienelactone hydrolase
VSRIDIGRVAIMGFSFGGRTALWTAYPSFQARYGAHAPRFAAHLGVYPTACYVEVVDEARIGDVPIRIFHGTADDWTPVEPCREFVARLRRAGKDAALFEYAEAGHRFDNDSLPSHQVLPDALSVRNCVFVERAGSIVDADGRVAGVDSPCYARGASIGYSADARRQSLADVHAFLRARFGSP